MVKKKKGGVVFFFRSAQESGDLFHLKVFQGYSSRLCRSLSSPFSTKSIIMFETLLRCSAASCTTRSSISEGNATNLVFGFCFVSLIMTYTLPRFYLLVNDFP